MKVNDLINEIVNGFEGEFFPNHTQLVNEYNQLIRTLLLMLPSADASVLLPVYDGKLEADISPSQIRRVFCGDKELLCASKTLVELMPEAMLYNASEDGITVTVNGDCTVYYRSLPKELSPVDAISAEIPIDARYIPLLRAWLLRSIHIYVGDFDGANAYGEEYNTLLEDFKRENGVAI